MNNNEKIKNFYLKSIEHAATNCEFDQLFESFENSEKIKNYPQGMSGENHSNENYGNSSLLIWDEIEKQIERQDLMVSSNEQKVRNPRFWWIAAAAHLLVVGLSVGIYWISGNNEYKIYKTGYGEVEKIILDDGSQVTLNANSVLKWKTNWKQEGQRIVILVGEAYFDVKGVLDQRTNRKIGFYVKTDDMTIEVVGTSFNVKSRTERTDVYLDEGRIQLDLNESKDENGKDEIVLNSGESLSYSIKSKKLARAKKAQYGNASWKMGTFMYTNQSVKEILLSLEEIYGVEFQIYDEKLLNQKLTTNLPYSDWPIVKSALELLLNVRLVESDEKIIKIM